MASTTRSSNQNENEQGKRCHQHQNHPNRNGNWNSSASFCFEGLRLSSLLRSLHSQIESERRSNKLLADKLWFKQQFAVGVNEVTRLLERMPPSSDPKLSIMQVKDSPSLKQRQCPPPCTFTTCLQAVLVASDCNPRWLTKHLLDLASSRNVRLIHVKDKKEGSLRLGELVKVKTAIVIGVKAKGSSINRLVQRVLDDDKLDGKLDA